MPPAVRVGGIRLLFSRVGTAADAVQGQLVAASCILRMILHRCPIFRQGDCKRCLLSPFFPFKDGAPARKTLAGVHALAAPRVTGRRRKACGSRKRTRNLPSTAPCLKRTIARTAGAPAALPPLPTLPPSAWRPRCRTSTTCCRTGASRHPTCTKTPTPWPMRCGGRASWALPRPWGPMSHRCCADRMMPAPCSAHWRRPMAGGLPTVRRATGRAAALRPDR